MTAKRKIPLEGQGNFRLYITTVIKRRQYSEGPYRFRTERDALAWLAGQQHVTVLEASLYHGEELIAKADGNGPCEVAS